MPDNDLVLFIPHTLGSAEAKRRIAGAAAGVKARYWQYLDAPEFEWDANRLNFHVTALAQTIKGTIDVEEKFVEASSTTPFRDTGARQAICARRSGHGAEPAYIGEVVRRGLASGCAWVNAAMEIPSVLYKIGSIKA